MISVLFFQATFTFPPNKFVVRLNHSRIFRVGVATEPTNQPTSVPISAVLQKYRWTHRKTCAFRSSFRARSSFSSIPRQSKSVIPVSFLHKRTRTAEAAWPTNPTREQRPNCPTGGPKKSAMAEITTPIARRKNLLGNHLRAAAVVPPQNPLKKSLKKSLPKKRRIPQTKHTREHKLNCQTDGPVKHQRTAKNITPIARRKKLLGNHLRAAPVVRLWQNQEENLPEKRRGW